MTTSQTAAAVHYQRLCNGQMTEQCVQESPGSTVNNSNINHDIFYNRTETSDHNSPTTPDVNSRPIALFTKQQFWRSVPQRYHFVGVWPLLVIGLVQPCKTKVGQLQFTTTIITPINSVYSPYTTAAVHISFRTGQRPCLTNPHRWGRARSAVRECREQPNIDHILNLCSEGQL